ncbi:hypothetical protein [Actinokineospora enzanensis]|uniref:hypothetical protein n=1 Tax=Actinokineospora enzanensis TaxID=155975 RepID=UPI00035FD3AE|nr:hypothetical protein [Actinokineospora enzanensis]
MDRTHRTRADELVAAAAEALAGEVTPGWARITLTVSATVLAWDFAVEVRDRFGGFGDVGPIPAAVSEGYQELRDLGYEPGRGTWFSAKLVLEQGSAPQPSFDYDDDPRWLPELHPTTFVRDLETYPRDDKHIPEWLRRILEEGMELERAHESDPGTDGRL